MKILILVNWKVKKCKEIPKDIQAPDYIVPQEKYWFFRYFPNDTEVDVIDISSLKFWENIEKKFFHFYIVQTIKAIFIMRKYDVILSHGMPSGILLAFFRRIFKTNSKHIVFDIGSFNSAAEKGAILKLNQYASKSIDGVIYHSSKQIEYYKKYFPWIVNKSKFLAFGTDLDYFKVDENLELKEENYIICIGYSMRDINTLLNAYKQVNTDIKLKIIGNENIKSEDKRVEIIGAVPKRDLNIIIQKAKFCILPLVDKNYSFGQMTLLQQMYFGKAVITSNVTSMIDYVEDKKTALLYEAENEKELKEKIDLLISDCKLVKFIGNNAKIAVNKIYNEKNMANEIYEFINKLV